MAVSLLLAGISGEPQPMFAAALLLVSRAVRHRARFDRGNGIHACGAPHERPQMAAVYRTYLDLAELLPPLVYSIVLEFFGLGAVFATLGVFSGVCGRLTWRYLPKSM